MLEKIRVKNFQSHKDSTIEPSEGITVLTGSSKSGKSAFLSRAIKWFTDNRIPQKSPYLRHKAKEMEVDLTFDGIEAKRIKSKSKNLYQLGDADPDEVVGNNVPEKVKDFLNLDDISLQGQHDMYFLLQNTSPGEVAKRLNKVAGFEIIDFVNSEVKSEISENSSDIKHIKSDIEELEKGIAEYEHLDEVEKRLEKIQKLVNEFNSKQELLTNIENTINEITEVNNLIEGLNDWLSIESEIKPILELINQYNKKSQYLKELEELLTEIEETEKIIQKLSDKSECKKDVELIQELIKEFNVQSEASQELSRLLEAINKDTKTINRYSENILELESELEELTLKLVEEGICPLCGSKITEDKFEHIKEFV